MASSTTFSRIEKMLPFHIIGSGSIGMLWAALIRSSHPLYPVTVLLRSHHKPRLLLYPDASSNTTTASTAAAEKNTDQKNHSQHFIQVAISGRYGNPTKATKNFKPDHSQSLSSSLMAKVPAQLILPLDDTTNENEEDQRHQSVNNPIQNLIVTTKAYQAAEAVESVLDRLLLQVEGKVDDEEEAESSPSSSSSTRNIILLCNGALSVQDELEKVILKKRKELLSTATTTEVGTLHQQQLPTTNLVLATTTHGAYPEELELDPSNNNNINKPTPYHIIHAGYGKTYIEDSVPDLGQIWKNVEGLNCTVLSPPQMQIMLWQKLAANCVINPLTALFNCPNGELLIEPSMPQISHEVIEEISKVALLVTKTTTTTSLVDNDTKTTNNINDDDKHSQQQFLHDEQEQIIPHHPLSSPALLRFVHQVIQDTLHNRSSMLQDVSNQQRTEVDHLNGYIVEKGRSFGLECPANEDLWQRILELTHKNIKR